MYEHHAGETSDRVPLWLRKVGFAYGYWATFLLILEPGNVVRAARAGHSLGLAHETARISAAAALGTAVTPLLAALARRYPLSGHDRWRNALIHAGSSVVLAAGLIVLSCVFAAWMFENRIWPTLTDMRDQLLRNWLLLSFALLACTALLHIAGVARKPEEQAEPERTRPRRLVRVSTRGRVQFGAEGRAPGARLSNACRQLDGSSGTLDERSGAMPRIRHLPSPHELLTLQKCHVAPDS